MIELNGSDFIFLIVTSTALLLILAGFFFAFVQLYQRKQTEYRTKRNQREQEFSNELIRVQLEIREELMQKLSHEIHDHIGQSLVVAKMQASSLINDPDSGRAEILEKQLTETIQNLRNLSKTLNGDYVLKDGINPAILKETELINSLPGVMCKLEGKIPSISLSRNAELILFRCIQELLGNALKHGSASQVRILISSSAEFISIEVSDNGQGLPPDWEGRKGLGIGSIKKRIALLNGETTLTSTPGQGTTFYIKLPKINTHSNESA